MSEDEREIDITLPSIPSRLHLVDKAEAERREELAQLKAERDKAVLELSQCTTERDEAISLLRRADTASELQEMAEVADDVDAYLARVREDER